MPAWYVRHTSIVPHVLHLSRLASSNHGSLGPTVQRQTFSNLPSILESPTDRSRIIICKSPGASSLPKDRQDT